MSTQEQMTLLRFTVLFRFTQLLGTTGKIKLQKLVYFLQERFKVSLHYSFRLHHYGPFAEEIEDDLSMMQSIGLIKIERAQDGYGFRVSPTAVSDVSWLPSLEKFEPIMKELVAGLGSLDSSGLELRATIHFAAQLLPNAPKNRVVEVVQLLKPKFPKSDIAVVYDSMAATGYLGG